MYIVYEHVNRLARAGHKVELWVPEGVSGKSLFENSVEQQVLDNSRLNDPDIVVLCDPAFWETVRSSRTKNGTFLLLQHDTELVAEGNAKQVYAQMMQDMIPNVKNKQLTLLVVSPWLQERMEERYGLDSIVIENGINHDLFHPSAPIVTTGHPTVLTVFDPQPWKGADKAIGILLEAHKNIPDLEVLILSKGLLTSPQAPALTFIFPFPTTLFYSPLQGRLAAIYASANVFLSTSDVEGFGLPALEAFACGVPVVTTNNGGNREFALDNETAQVIHSDNLTKAAKKLENLLTNQTVQERLKGSALNMAERYSWDKIISRLTKLFENQIML